MATVKRSAKTIASKMAAKKVTARKPGKSRRLDLRVDDDTFAAVHELAQREQRPVSDVVRDALRRYADAS